MSNTIKFNVGFDIDQSSLKTLKNSLEDIQRLTKKDLIQINHSSLQTAEQDLREIKNTASSVEDALSAAFNAKLNTINIQTFNKEISKVGLNIEKINSSFSKAGPKGNAAFRNIAHQITAVNMQLKESHNVLDKIGETLGNTLKWGVASSIMNRFSGAVQEAYGYVKALDGSLNDIRIVTGKSAESMADFAKEANQAAKDLGTSTTNYTKSALTFYQQGLGEKDVKARANISNKVSNVTGLSGDQSAEYVTAVLNGYKVGSEEAEEAMDKLAAVAASTASDLAELSEGMSKTASAANAMGVSEDQLAATLSTVISTTRQSAASVGTAFKTIYSRIADIKAGSDEAEVSLGEYTGRMNELGFSVLDSEGNLKDLGVVMEEIGGSWKNLSREQQVALARTMAGTRQYNNLIALFDNWDEYIKSVNVSLEANGTLQQQQNIYLEGTAAHLRQLSASMEDVYDSLLEPEAINSFADIFAGLANVTADWLDSIGGGESLLKNLGSVAVMVFSRQIAKGLNTAIGNLEIAKRNTEQLKSSYQKIIEIKDKSGKVDGATQQMLDLKASLIELAKHMSPEKFNEMSEGINNFVNAASRLDTLKSKEQHVQDIFNTLGFSEQPFTEMESYEDVEIAAQNKRTELDTVRKEALSARDDAKKDNKGLYRKGSKTARIESSPLHNIFKNIEKIPFSESDTKAINEIKNEYQKSIVAYNNKVKDPEQSGNLKKLQQDLENKYKSSFSKILGIINRSDKEVEEFLEELIKDPTSLSKEIKEAEEAQREVSKKTLDEIRDGARAEVISGFNQLTGAITSVGFAIQTVQNLGSIWNNDDLTTGEKILQTFTNLATALPMLISGLYQAQAGWAAMGHGMKAYTNATVAAEGAQKKLNLAMLKNPYVIAAAAIISLISVLAILNKHQKQTIENNKQRAAAQRDAALAMHEEDQQIRTLYEDYTALYNTYEKTGEGEDKLRESTLSLADAYGVEIDALDLLAGRYDVINEKLEKAKEKQTNEHFKKAQEGLRAAGTTGLLGGTNTVGNIDFSSGWSTGDGDYKLINFLSEEMNKILPKGVEMYGGKIFGMTSENYAQVYESIQSTYNKMLANKNLQSDMNSGEIDDSIQEWLSENAENYGAYKEMENAFETYAAEFATTEISVEPSEIVSYEDFENYRQEYIKILQGIFADEGIEKSEEDIKLLANKYLETIDYVSEYAQVSAAKDSIYNKMVANLEEPKEKEETVESLYAEFDRNKRVIFTETLGLNKKSTVEDLENTIKHNIVNNTNTEHNEWLKGLIESIKSSQVEVDNTIEKFEEVQKFVDNLNEREVRLLATVDIDEGATKDEIMAALEYAEIKANNEGGIEIAKPISVISELSGKEKLSKEEQEQLDGANAELDRYLAATKGIRGMTSAAEEWAEVSKQGTLAQIEYLQDLTTHENAYANATAKNVELELNAQEKYLKTTQKRLQQEAKAINDKKTKIEEYRKRKNEEGFDSKSEDVMDIFGSEEEFQTAIAEVDAYEAKVLEVASALDEVRERLSGNLTFEADMSNVEEILTVGDTILSEAEKIKSAAELIGEGFTVAAEDADKLAAVFPEILKNATVTTDGIIHLDENVAKELLGNQADILNGDTESAVAKIDNQIAINEARIEDAKLRIRLAGEVAKGEKNIEQATAEYMVERSQYVTEEVMDDNNQLVNSHHEVADAKKGAIEGKRDGNETHYRNGMPKGIPGLAMDSIQQQIADDEQAKKDKEERKRNEEARRKAIKNNPSLAMDAAQLQLEDDAVWSEKQAEWPETLNNIDQYIQDAENEIEGYKSRNAALIALKAKLYANQNDALDSLNGGSGSGSGKDSDLIDHLIEEYDIYHDIDIKIQDIEKHLNKLQKQQERLTGRELINNLNEQLDIIDKQRGAYKEKIDLAKNEAEIYKQLLVPYGATFDDSTGQLTNYFDILEKEKAKLNETIEWYNGLSAEAQTDEAKAKVDAAQASYDNLKDFIEKYEETTNDTIPDLEEMIEEALTQEIEIKISKFETEIQLHLDVSQMEREWNDFKKQVIDDIDDDDFLGQAKYSLANINTYFNEEGTGTTQVKTDKVNTILAEIGKMRSGGHSDIYSAYDESTGTWVHDYARAEEDLKNGWSELMGSLTEVKELQDAVAESFLNSIDATNEAFDKQKEAYEFIGDQIEHDLTLMKLLYGDDAYDKMDKYYTQQIDNTKTLLSKEQERRVYWKSKMIAEQEAVAAGTGNKEALAKYEENWKNSISNVNSLVEEWADQVTQKYENTIDNLIGKLNDKVSNGLGLEYLDEELSLLNDNSENYLDPINSAYSKQNLANKWQDAIDNTDSISAQRELNELMQEQLKMLEEKGKLTQYDIDRAEKEYQIALKQIALQEAQQNKSTMRLKRDANGNYSYQYVADEDGIRDAEQELAQAQNDLYNFDKDAYQNNLNQSFEVWNEYQQKIAEAYKTYGNDKAKLDEQLALLQEQYGEKLNFLTEQNLNIRKGLTESAIIELNNYYGTDVQNFDNMTQKEIDLVMTKLIPQWGSGIQQMMDKMTAKGGFEEVCKGAFDELSEAAGLYQGEIGEIGKKNEEISKEAIEEGTKIITKTGEVITARQDEMEALKGVGLELDQLILKYGTAKQAAIDAAKATKEYFDITNKKSSSDSNSSSNSSSDTSNSSDSGSTSSSGSGSDSSSTSAQGGISSSADDDSLDINDIITYTGRYYSSSLGAKPTGSRYADQKDKVKIDKINGNTYGIHIRSVDKSYPDLGWIKRSQISGFDTGGYTGQWGSDGRLALLHQKELVLNANDTHNMLNAVSILRDIVDRVGENAFAHTASLLDNLNGNANNYQKSELLEQNVHITASFEGQTEATQIEAALNNLINIAAQRANR